MDWSHPQETWWLHSKDSTGMESTREVKERAAKTVMEANSHGKIRLAGNNLGCCKENCAKQDSLESDG